MSRPRWRQPHIHESLAIRTALPNVHPPRAVLADCPPHRMADVVRDFRAGLAKLGRIVFGAAPATGNPGLWAILQGKGEMASDPIRRLRRRAARLKRRGGPGA
jgi:hypothetical protein